MQVTSAPRPKTIDPKTQQFLQEHPADPQNLVDMYDSLSPLQKKQGRNWYPSANLVAHHIAAAATKNTGRTVTADQVAGHMANYSGQTQWHNNIHEAFLAAHGIFPGEHGAGWRSPIDGKGFMATGKQAEISRRIQNGEDWRNLLSPVKEGSFGQNIAAGGTSMPGHTADGSDLQSRDGRVHLTTDRHHVSAAHGAYADENVYKSLGLNSPENYDRYTDLTVEAANRINARDPSAPPIHPVGLQASVWLGQQLANASGGYSDPGSAARSIKSAASNKARLEGVLSNHGMDELTEKAPVVGFPGTGGALSLNHVGETPITPTYHGMPGPDGQQQSPEPWPEHAPSPQQIRVQQENGMAKALTQAGMKAPAAKGLGKQFDSQFNPNSLITDHIGTGMQNGGYDPTHTAAASGQQFPHYHDTPAGQAALSALNAAGMPTPDRQTNQVPKIPAPQQAVAHKTAWFVRQTSWFVRKTASTKPFFVRI